MNKKSQTALEERFDILEVLSEDLASRRVLARDRKLNREVILQLPGKGILKRLSARDRESALREARVLARVNHPSVAGLIDVIETDGLPVSVLEYRAGETLRERLKKNTRLDPEEVLRLGLEISKAAGAVHAVGAVHRTISEANVLLEPSGAAVLTGFEFTKQIEFGAGGTSLSFRQTAGTALPSYPAPEQIDGKAADVRSEIFSLGCVLYRCLTGHPAFDLTTLLEWTPPRNAAEFRPEAPRRLVEAIHRCLERSPSRRYQSMNEFAAALDSASPSKHETSPGWSGSATGSPGTRRWPRELVLASSLVAVIGVVLFAPKWLNNARDESDSRGRPLLSQTEKTGDIYQPLYHTSHALLIGIDYAEAKSGYGRLQNAERDVDAIADELLGIGWDDENILRLKGKNASRRNIERALEDLENTAGPDDQVFVYYAGHGEVHSHTDKSGWAIPADAGPRRDGRTGENWLHFDCFDRFFVHSRAKHVLIALDCCHSGAMARGGTSLEKAYSERFLTEKAHVLLASSRPNDRAWDGDGKHSPFAEAFIAGLRTARESPMTATKLQGLIQETLASQTYSQVSILNPRLDTCSGNSDFVFLDRSSPGN